MIPREILEQALVDYEKAVEEIQGMEGRSAMEYLEDNSMDCGLCYYMEAKFDMCEIALVPVFGVGFLGGTRGCYGETTNGIPIPTLTARLQLRINKLKELLNDNPLPLPK